MTALLNKMIKEADNSKDQQKNSSIAKLSIPGVGDVICYRMYDIRSHKTCLPKNTRTAWKLNGKVISQNALSALVAN
jgi:hypothetical protein